MKIHKYEDILNEFYTYLEGKGFVQDRVANSYKYAQMGTFITMKRTKPDIII